MCGEIGPGTYEKDKPYGLSNNIVYYIGFREKMMKFNYLGLELRT